MMSLGVAMLAAPFVGLFILAAHLLESWRASAAIFGIVTGLTAWIVLAVWLIKT